MVTNARKDRALHARLQGRAARVRFQETSGNETLKDHLVGIVRGPRALLRCPHGPGKQRQAEDVAGNPGRGAGNWSTQIGDEMRPVRNAWRRWSMPRRCSCVSFVQ
jgi:hypothetical protein